MTKFDTTRYPSEIGELLTQLPLAPLGPGTPDHRLRNRLKALKESTFGRSGNPDMAAACRAGLWLAFNFLDESHAISQELETPEGSYWHALMHRREPDFANAAYWFRRVGTHPVYSTLGSAVAELAAGTDKGAFLVRQTRWDPFAFVNLCQDSIEEKTPGHELCRQVQRIEWGLLFAYCWERAMGDSA